MNMIELEYQQMLDREKQVAKRLNEKLYGKIKVSHDFPPIPVRDFDYSAVRDGYDGEGCVGRGASPDLAIDDLIESEAKD